MLGCSEDKIPNIHHITELKHAHIEFQDDSKVKCSIAKDKREDGDDSKSSTALVVPGIKRKKRKTHENNLDSELPEKWVEMKGEGDKADSSVLAPSETQTCKAKERLAGRVSVRHSEQLRLMPSKNHILQALMAKCPIPEYWIENQLTRPFKQQERFYRIVRRYWKYSRQTMKLNYSNTVVKVTSVLVVNWIFLGCRIIVPIRNPFGLP